MANKVPFKVKGGLDANMSRVQQVADPVQDYDAVNKLYVDSISVAAVKYVYVSSVISTDVGSPANNTVENGIFITQTSTAADEVTITINFDRSIVSWNIPDIQYGWSPDDDPANVSAWASFFSEPERQGVDFTQTTVPSFGIKNGTLTIEADKKTFRYEYDEDISTLGAENFLIFRNATNYYILEFSVIQAPEIASAEITTTYSTYGALIDELHNGRNVTFSVTADTEIAEVQVNGTYYTSNTEVKSGTNLTETISTTVTGGPSSTDTAVNAYFQIRVRDVNGTWSEWYDSSSDSPTNDDETDYMMVNNTSPVFSGLSIEYPGTQTGLDDNQTAVITYSSLQYLGTGGTAVQSDLGSNFTSTSKINDTEYTATADDGIYQYNTNTFRVTATRVKNGRETQSNAQVNIASIDMVIGNMSVTTFRTGPTPGHTTNFNITGTNQQVAARTITLAGTAPTGMDIMSEGSISGVNVNNAQLRVDDDVTRQSYTDVIEVEFTGISGRTVEKEFTVSVQGFVERTLTGLNITSPVQIPEVHTATNVVVSLGDGTNNNVLTFSNQATNVSYSYSYDYAISDQILEFQVFEDGGDWFITFDETTAANAAGNYANNATLIIEETI